MRRAGPVCPFGGAKCDVAVGFDVIPIRIDQSSFAGDSVMKRARAWKGVRLKTGFWQAVTIGQRRVAE